MIQAIRRRVARPFRKIARKAQVNGQWMDALFQLDIARKVDPSNLAITLQIGNMYTELDQFDRAAECFERTTENATFRLRGLIGLAGIAERTQNWAAAVDRWESVMNQMAAEDEAGADGSTWPMSFAVALVHCALSRDMSGDHVKAERDLVLAIALEPRARRSREAILMRARMIGSSNVGGAYRVLRAGRDHYPDDHVILFELARAALRTGRRAEAGAHARDLLEMRPFDEVAVKLVQEFET